MRFFFAVMAFIFGFTLQACTSETSEDGSKAYIDRNGNGEMDIFEDNAASRSERVADLLQKLSVEQKVSLVSGIGFAIQPEEMQSRKVPGAAGFTTPIEDLGIPSIVLADGPAGARILPTRQGTNETYYATAFPVATLLASSWNLDLVEEVGVAFGHEFKEYGLDILLAPGINIHRDPRGGRNFEYYSEDPLLNGKMSAAMVRGVQSQGVGATPKHYVANNQETNRYVVDTLVSERTLREIYLKGFEITVKESDPWAIMSAYNQVNGTPASQSKSLITTVLRDEWGFNGVVMTDWFAGMDDTVAQMIAGNELLMPGMPDGSKQIMAALADGSLSEARLDENVGRILDVIMRSSSWAGYEFSNKPKLADSAELARRAAAEGAVLLKNEGAVLPLSDNVTKLAVFGNQSYDFISGGTGSGDVNEAYTVSLVDGLLAAGLSVDDDLRSAYVEYLTDYKAAQPEKERFWTYEPPAPELSLEATMITEKAADADAALITIGRNSGEFQDRPLQGDFYLTAEELSLIETVSAAFKQTDKPVVVVLNIGNVVETVSWRAAPDAILVPWQGGQEAGNAVVDVLLGKVSPSGKLPTTFPVSYEVVPSAENFPGEATSDEIMVILDIFEAQPSEVKYEEGIYVGYRYYDTVNQEVAYPFGYGLAYTSFSYSNLSVLGDVASGELEVEVVVTNTGERAGREVVQLYVSAPEGVGVDKPEQELRGFTKTRRLAPGESTSVVISLDAHDLASFDTDRRAWVAEAGEYELRVSASSRDTRATHVFSINEAIVTQEVIARLDVGVVLNELKP